MKLSKDLARHIDYPAGANVGVSERAGAKVPSPGTRKDKPRLKPSRKVSFCSPNFRGISTYLSGNAEEGQKYVRLQTIHVNNSNVK